MKKTLLLIAFGASVLSASAQFTLPATSPYTQNFDGLPAYPAGWSTYAAATATSLGTLHAIQYVGQSYPSTVGEDTSTGTCIGGILVGGFKNFPSANVSNPGDNYCWAPPTYTNRALGVRQVGETNANFLNSDGGTSGGVAFVLKIDNTSGRKSLNLSFNLQSLDTASKRITTWIVDYAVATSPTVAPTAFTPLTTVVGTMTTGHNTFSHNTITADFGTALDNKHAPVYIRIAALAPTTLPAGDTAGNRASSAIDDFTLTYVTFVDAVTETTVQPQLDLAVLGNATSDKVTLGYTVEEAGDYSFAIYDITGRVVYHQMVHAASGTEQLAVNGLNLTKGMYIAKMNNANASSVAKMIIQ